MRPGSLAQLVHNVLPRLSLRAQAVVDALLLTGGDVGTATELASHLGLSSRFRFARLLKSEGLPALHDLAGWARVLRWLEQAESNGCSLCRLAFSSKKDPAACYRTVKRVTGVPWRELRRRGSRWLIADFLIHCGAQRNRTPN